MHTDQNPGKCSTASNHLSLLPIALLLSPPRKRLLEIKSDEEFNVDSNAAVALNLVLLLGIPRFSFQSMLGNNEFLSTLEESLDR